MTERTFVEASHIVSGGELFRVTVASAGQAAMNMNEVRFIGSILSQRFSSPCDPFREPRSHTLLEPCGTASRAEITPLFVGRDSAGVADARQEDCVTGVGAPCDGGRSPWPKRRANTPRWQRLPYGESSQREPSALENR